MAPKTLLGAAFAAVLSLSMSPAAQAGIYAPTTRAHIHAWPDADVREFGAVCNDTADDTAAIQSAIDAVSSTGGGTVYLPAGKTCKTTATLTIGNGSSAAASTAGGVILEGSASRNVIPNAFGFSGSAAAIDYQGTGAAIEIDGPLMGWGLQNLQVVCATLSSGSVGIQVLSAQFGDSRNISVSNCAKLINSTVVSARPAGVNNADDLHNSWHNVFLKLNGSASFTVYGIVETGIGGVGNTDYNDWDNVVIDWGGVASAVGYGIDLQAADSNYHHDIHFFGNSSGTFHSVFYDYTVTAGWPASNTIDHIDVGSTGDFTTTGTPSGSAAPNWLSDLVMTNGAVYPTALKNLIVDHMAGAWTPILEGSTAAGTVTYTTQSGWFENNGYSVVARFHIVTSAISGATGSMLIDGIPFTNSSTTGDVASCSISRQTGVTLDTGYTILSAIIAANGAKIQLVSNGSGKTFATTPVTDFASAIELVGECTYRRNMP